MEKINEKELLQIKTIYYKITFTRIEYVNIMKCTEKKMSKDTPRLLGKNKGLNINAPFNSFLESICLESVSQGLLFLKSQSYKPRASRREAISEQSSAGKQESFSW